LPLQGLQHGVQLPLVMLQKLPAPRPVVPKRPPVPRQGLDRFAARTASVEGFRSARFACAAVPPHFRSRFREPPFSSRTVGFPESGWRPRLSPVGLPSCVLHASSKFKRWLAYTPTMLVCRLARHPWSMPHSSGTVSRCGSFGCPPCAESPFAPLRRYLVGSDL
jgi:hypothetical protein